MRVIKKIAPGIVGAALFFTLAFACKKDPIEIWREKQRPKIEDTTVFGKKKFIDIGKRKMLGPEGAIQGQAGDTSMVIPLKQKPFVAAPGSE